jgi:hypothetical protein
MIKTNSFALAGATAVILLMLGACGRDDSPTVATTENTPAAQAEATSLPAPVNGWVEHPLKEGVIKLQAADFRTDTIEIPLPAQSDLEYKLQMKQGDAVVYSIEYGTLANSSLVISEFHGHTEKRADGVGDLMFYSKTDGTAQHGQFVAPWDGVQGWYLKNDSSDDIAVTLKLAGFYELGEH